MSSNIFLVSSSTFVVVTPTYHFSLSMRPLLSFVAQGAKRLSSVSPDQEIPSGFNPQNVKDLSKRGSPLPSPEVQRPTSSSPTSSSSSSSSESSTEDCHNSERYIPSKIESWRESKIQWRESKLERRAEREERRCARREAKRARRCLRKGKCCHGKENDHSSMAHYLVVQSSSAKGVTPPLGKVDVFEHIV